MQICCTRNIIIKENILFFWAMAFSAQQHKIHCICMWRKYEMLLGKHVVFTGRICRSLLMNTLWGGSTQSRARQIILSLSFLSFSLSLSPPLLRKKICWLQTFPSEKNGDPKTIAQNTICICAPEPVGFSVRSRNSCNPTLFKQQP